VDTSKTGKRRYRSVELKRQIVEETLEVGTSVAVIARRHGVNANQVFSWRRQYQRGELVCPIQDAREVPLLPVEIHQPAALTESSPADEVSAAENCLEIEFPGGRHIRVWGRADPEALRTAIRELSQS
jgi:transposase